MSPNLSKAQLLNFLQCPRRFWLEQYHPEHEGDVAAMDAILDAEEAADAAAYDALVGDNIHAISGRLGLRSAIEQTSTLLKPGVILLDATFEHEGISAHVNVLDWSGESRRAISVTAAAEISSRIIEDCAIQAWVLGGLGLPEHLYCIGLSTGNQDAGVSFDARFKLADVTDQVQAEVDRVGSSVPEARALHASIDEPAASTGAHCHNSGYACPFLDYCEQR